MRLLALVFVTLLLGASPSQEPGGYALSDLLSPGEMRSYQSRPAYKHRIDLFRKVLDRYSRMLTSQVKQEKWEESLEILRKIRSLAGYGAREGEGAHTRKELRSTAVKKLEIRLRKLMERLRDLKRAAPFQYGQEFDTTIERLELLRSRLLKQLFGQALSERMVLLARYPALAAFSLAPGVPRQRRGQSTITGDQFTDREYEKIQLAQELPKRVDAFLEIARHRMRELRRRLEKKEWKDKKPNPLEFFTPAQLVHAYWRALEGVMVNIDEKARYHSAPEKEIRKTLKKLNSSVLDFMPQLEPIQQWAKRTGDEELIREVLQAEKTTEIARKGSQLGLGAPVK